MNFYAVVNLVLPFHIFFHNDDPHEHIHARCIN